MTSSSIEPGSECSKPEQEAKQSHSEQAERAHERYFDKAFEKPYQAPRELLIKRAHNHWFNRTSFE